MFATRALLCACAVIVLAGCAAPQSAALRASLSADSAASVDPARAAPTLPPRAAVAGVPFVPQDDYQCGPAALAMSLAAAGRPVELQRLVDAVYLPSRRGSLQAEMLAQPRRESMLSIPIEPRLASMLQLVADGVPVLVFQNLALSWAPIWHYAVLIGYDLPAGLVVLHSGTEASMPMSIDAFERTWARAGSWSMIVVDPSRVPPQVSVASALRAAVALERLDRAASLRAYDALLARAPGDRLVGFARANALLADERPREAIDAFNELLGHHPDFADAWNNLAHAYADAGDAPAAQRAAERAVALGGASIAVYRQTAERMRRQASAAPR
ncbi:MAG: PA2778 family cysteine peptidase [Burkholderiaceae bacterium]|nr:PA2778 family cysteine peptidase [Burkholderiaceae bacterium]